MKKYLLKHIAFYLFILLITLFTMVGMFYLSLAAEVYWKIKNVDKVSNEFAKFISLEDGEYVFGKDIYFTPSRATFQTDGARVYLYLSNSAFDEAELQNLKMHIIRDSYGEIKKEDVPFSMFEKGIDYFIVPGYSCFSISSIRVFSGYNNFTFTITGIKSKKPAEDIRIMLFFNGIKGRVILWEYLFKGVLMLTFSCMFFISVVYYRKKVIPI